MSVGGLQFAARTRVVDSNTTKIGWPIVVPAYAPSRKTATSSSTCLLSHALAFSSSSCTLLHTFSAQGECRPQETARMNYSLRNS